MQILNTPPRQTVNMKHLFIATFTLATLVCAQAQTTAPAKKPAASAPKPALKIRPMAPMPAATPAPPAAPKEALLSRDELRACFKTQAGNEAESAALQTDQAQFKIDYDAIRAEQEVLSKENATNRAKQSELAAERDAVSNASSTLQAKALANTKPSDAEKAALEAERNALVERAKALDDNIGKYNAAIAAARECAAKIDPRVAPINERSKSINARVETLNNTLKEWRAKCSDKPYDEADELVVKRELAAAQQAAKGPVAPASAATK